MSQIFDEVHLLEGSKEFYGIATKFQNDLTILEMQQLSEVNFNKILKFIFEKNLKAWDLTIIYRPVSEYRYSLIGILQDDPIGTLGMKFKGSKMNNIDNSRQQYQLLGNSVRLTPIEPQALPQNEKLLTRELLADMAKSGKIEEAFDMIWEAIEGFNKRIKELEEK